MNQSDLRLRAIPSLSEKHDASRRSLNRKTHESIDSMAADESTIVISLREKGEHLLAIGARFNPRLHLAQSRHLPH